MSADIIFVSSPPLSILATEQQDNVALRVLLRGLAEISISWPISTTYTYKSICILAKPLWKCRQRLNFKCEVKRGLWSHPAMNVYSKGETLHLENSNN